MSPFTVFILSLALCIATIDAACAPASTSTHNPYLLCGNGRVDAPERCDDGNNVPGDGCSASCTEECGSWCGCGSPSTCAPSYAVVCHKRPGHKRKTLTVARHVLAQRLAYGDTLGACPPGHNDDDHDDNSSSSSSSSSSSGSGRGHGHKDDDDADDNRDSSSGKGKGADHDDDDED